MAYSDVILPVRDFATDDPPGASLVYETRSVIDRRRLAELDRQADAVIKRWTVGGFAANLLPPPMDTIAVTAAFARMGYSIGRVYGVEVSSEQLKPIGKAMWKGMGTVTLASRVGTSLLKYVPGVGLWTALLIQPPIVAAVAYTVGDGFKQYYRLLLTEGRELTHAELEEIAATALRSRIG